MASAISYEYLMDQKGKAGGIASLDASGNVPDTQLPSSVINPYKGTFETEAALKAEYPEGELGDSAYVTATSSKWYWNPQLTTPAWVNSEINEAAYIELSDEAKAAVPYIITA